ncbi:unnamed protein product [Caenorhabditis bovis]|uniref:Myosin N-terminal SH3-like domain-containing protein n=1 Tax=Caenorhabditis bovis TaxID=2654633 RepID=A0A8S1E734_9PELO|nr:unnamed protein product [Caenorhabditis bovis]
MSHESDPGWQYLRQSAEQLLAATTKKFDSKKNVWIADPEEGFIAAEIKSTKGDTITVVTSKGAEKTLKKDDAQQMNPPKYEKTEDMANLTFLNDASVLHNLRQRYYSMMIYGELACKLFCVEAEKFVNSLLKPRVKVGTEWVNKGQNLEQVNWAVEEKKRKDKEAEVARLEAEKQALLIQLEQERDSNAEGEERSAKLLAQKADLEKQMANMNDQLCDEEEKNAALQKAKKKVEQDNEGLKKTVSDLETTIKKQESEKQSKDHQIRSLQVIINN